MTVVGLAERVAVGQDCGQFPHVLDGVVLVGAAACLAAMLDRKFLDEAACCLIGCYDLSSQFTVTTDMHVRYYRQPHGGPLIAEAKLVHGGRRLLSTECSVVDPEDRVLVRTTATYMLIPTGGLAVPARMAGPTAP